MLKARSFDGVDPTGATDERRHALELAEGFGGPRLVAEACGALCWSETVAFGAPITERYVRRGLEVGASTGLLPRFVLFEALYRMELGELAAAEQRFTDALALAGPNLADVHAGLGTLLLRGRRFDEALRHFGLSLSSLGRGLDGDVAHLRAIDGRARAELQLGDDRGAGASWSRVLELTAEIGRDASRVVQRRYRARAFNALGLLRWRAGDEAEALRYFRHTLDLWPDAAGLRTAEALIALERHAILRHAAGPVAAPIEANPGDEWAVGFLRLGRDALTPLVLPESPRSAARVEQLRALSSGDAFEEPLRPVLGDVGRAWFVSRVRTLRASRCVLVDLVPDESGGR